MNKKSITFLIALSLICAIPLSVVARAYVVQCYKLEPCSKKMGKRRITSEQIAKKQIKFAKLCKNRRHIKQYGPPELIAYQQVPGTRPSKQLKLLSARVKKIEAVAKQFDLHNTKQKAIENLKKRLHIVKKIA